MIMINIEHSALEGELEANGFITDRFKSETLSLYFRLPVSKEESVIRTLLLSVLKRGCEGYPSQKELNKRLDELYAAIIKLENRKYGAEQLIGVSLDLIKSRYTDGEEDLIKSALDLVSRLLFRPVLDENGYFLEEYVNSEKQNYKDLILSQINEPRSYAAIRCREHTFAELEIIHTLEETAELIDKITPAALTEYYRSVVLQADLRVFYVGEAPIEEIAKKISLALPEREIAGIDIPTFERKTLAPAEERVVIEERESSQSRLVISLGCSITHDDPEYYAMSVCNEVLGVSPISKLMMQVRERLGLCYECSSSYDSARGTIFISSGIDGADFDRATDAIKEQINSLGAGNITEAELNAAKKSLTNAYKSIYDVPNGIERFYLGRIVRGSRESVEDAIAAINSVSLERVVAASQGIFVHTVFFLKGKGDCEVLCDE